MREAGEDYPEWLKKRYLQIPKDFSLRITELAQQIAGDEPTAYDKTMAITQYLRRTINYSVTIENPPDNREPLEWFLFDQRAGFCNYYASSEVMMLRSLGVPARLAVGYAQGAWNDDQKAYVVLGKDSHSWPEVYFPGIGWVPFEPTVSQPLGVYPAGDETPDESREREAVGPSEPTFDPFRQAQQAQPFDGGELDQLNQGIKIAPWQIVLFTALVVLGLMTFLEWRRSRKQGLPLPGWLEKTLDEHGLPTPQWLRIWSRRSLRTPMESLFATVGWMLKVWGQKIEPVMTPAEQVAALVNVVPGIQEPAVVLLEEYQRAMYSQYPANIDRARDAVSEIRSIGYKNWLLRLVGFEL